MKQAFYFMLLCFSLLQLQLNGQIDYDKFPSSVKKVLIKDLLVVSSAGATPTKNSILISKGKIEQIGSNIKPSFDCKTIPLDSLYAYPGFIAGLTHAGLKQADESKNNSKVKFPGAPPNKRAGITPELTALDFYDPSASNIEQYRKAGFTAMQAAPKGRMLPGSSDVFLLSGKEAHEVGLNEKSGMFSQFKGADGVYPRTVIAIIAKWKDLYNNAKYAGQFMDGYHSNSNLDRPNYDPSIKALIPLTKGNMPLYFKAPKLKDLYRALSLQKDLGCDMVLTDVRQATAAFDNIKRSGAQVLLSPKLPKEIKEDELEDEDLDDEQRAFIQRKLQSNEAYLSQAAELEKANIPFGFSFLESKPDELKEQLMKMIEKGLSEKAALAALTSYPAKLLGVENQLGSIQQGKLANMVICDKPYFEKDSKIKYVIVEGEIFEYEEKKKKEAKDGPLLDLLGTWDFELEIFGETDGGKLVLSGSEEIPEILIYGDDEPDDPSEAKNVKREGNKLSFDFEAETDGGMMEFQLDLDFEEEVFEGTLSGSIGSFPMKGTKINSPE